MTSAANYLISISYAYRTSPTIFDYILIKIVEHIPEFNKNKPLEDILIDLGFNKEIHYFFSSSLDHLLDMHFLTLYSDDGLKKGWFSNNLMNVCRDDLVLTPEGSDFINGKVIHHESEAFTAIVEYSDSSFTNVRRDGSLKSNHVKPDFVKPNPVDLKRFISLNKDILDLPPNVSILDVKVIGLIDGVVLW